MACKNDVRPKSLARIKTKAQADKFIKEQIAEIKAQVGDGKVLLALSGGVDSSVCAALISKAIGKQLTCVFVDQGLLARDARAFRKYVSDIQPDIDLRFYPDNGPEEGVQIPITVSFLWSDTGI